MSRRVITVTTINELLAKGETCLQLEPGDIITALASEDAQSRGLRVVPAANAGRSTGGAKAEPIASAPGETQSAAVPSATPLTQALAAESNGEGDYAEVRKAVIAALGHAPQNLDQIISKVMK